MLSIFLILQLSCPILGKGREPWERGAAALSYGRKSKMPVSLNYVKIIRDLREDADKTQQEIADVLHTSQTMYARYERGAKEK